MAGYYPLMTEPAGGRFELAMVSLNSNSETHINDYGEGVDFTSIYMLCSFKSVTMWKFSLSVAFNAQMQLLITSLLEVVKTCGDWQQMELLHISVSRTVILRHHWIDLLMTDIRQSLATIPNFHCDLASVQLYTNDERTRFVDFTGGDW